MATFIKQSTKTKNIRAEYPAINIASYCFYLFGAYTASKSSLNASKTRLNKLSSVIYIFIKIFDRKPSSVHHMMNRRRLSIKNFNEDVYHRRELIESGFGSVKRRFGSSVSSKKIKTIRSDIYGRLLCHNIFCFYRLLG